MKELQTTWSWLAAFCDDLGRVNGSYFYPGDAELAESLLVPERRLLWR